MTKTIILGTIIAVAIISTGITMAYAGNNIKLSGTVDADGNQVKNVGKATDTSDAVNLGTLNDALDSGVPSSGPGLEKKWVIFENSTGLYLALLDKDLNKISTGKISLGPGDNVVDTVLDGQNLIVTMQNAAGDNFIVYKFNGTNGEIINLALFSEGMFKKQIDAAKTSTPDSLQKVSMTPMNVIPGNTASANVDCPADTEVVSYSAYANDASTGDRLFFEDGVSVFPDQYSDASGTGVRFTVDNSGGSVEVVANATTVCGNLPEAP